MKAISGATAAIASMVMTAIRLGDPMNTNTAPMITATILTIPARPQKIITPGMPHTIMRLAFQSAEASLPRPVTTMLSRSYDLSAGLRVYRLSPLLTGSAHRT